MKPFDLLFQDSPDVAFLKKELKVRGDFPMSKKSAMKNKLTGKRPLQAVTRKEQVKALRTLKAREVAEHVAGSIRDATRQEVELQVGAIKSAMFELIDSVAKLGNEVRVLRDERLIRTRNGDESDSPDRQQGAEAPEVSGDPEVVQRPGCEGPTSCGPLKDSDYT